MLLIQVFRGFDVGSAKVTPEEADTVRHHLLDVAEVDSEAFSVASFCDLAQKTIKVLRGGGGGASGGLHEFPSLFETENVRTTRAAINVRMHRVLCTQCAKYVPLPHKKTRWLLSRKLGK